MGAGHVKIVPDVQVGGESGVLGGLGALLMRSLATPGTNGIEGNGIGNGSDGDGDGSDDSVDVTSVDVGGVDVASVDAAGVDVQDDGADRP